MKKKSKKSVNGEQALKEQLARALADYDNLKKRAEREQEDCERRSAARLVARLFPVIDMLEQVQGHLQDSGLAIALGELAERLKEEDIEAIEPKRGEQFNEETMEAVETVADGELKEGKVTAVNLKGYRMGDRILRHAKVVVCVAEQGGGER